MNEHQTPEQSEEAARLAQIDRDLETHVMNAIIGDGVFPVTAKVFEKTPHERELTVWMKWPDQGQEQAITRRTLAFTDGLPRDLLDGLDYDAARGRAVIEVLAQPDPNGGGFPYFLPPADVAVEIDGVRMIRPDTSKIKARAIILAIYWQYLRVYSRFQYMGSEPRY